MSQGVVAGSIYYELGVREADLSALERRIKTAGETLSKSLNPQTKAPETFRSIVKELELLDRKAKAGLISESQLADGMRRLGVEAKTAAQGTSGLEDRIGRIRDRMSLLTSEFERGAVSPADYRKGLESLSGSLEKVKTQSGLTTQNLLMISQGMNEAKRGLEQFQASTASGGKRTNELQERVKGLKNEIYGLRSAYIAGDISQKDFVAEMGRLKRVALDAAQGLDRTSKEFRDLNVAAATAERGLASARGEASRLGLASQVNIALQNSLQGTLLRMGPAGAAAALGISAFATANRKATADALALQGVMGTLAPILLATGLVFGGLFVAGAVAASRAAVQLEEAQADVVKTTELTGQEIGELTNRLQNLSTQIGTPTKDLLGIAAVAGQLGVRGVANLTAFTDTIAKLALATDIVGEEGASQLARLINVTQEAGQSVGEAARLYGNVINALGNSLPATEAQILAVAVQVAQLKQATRISQPDLLAYAATLKSVGIEAELGGNAITKLFIGLEGASRGGGEQLTAYAAAARVTADEFRNLTRSSPADAFEKLVGGLKAAKDEGRDLVKVVEGLGITQDRERRVLLSLVGGYDKLVEARKTANEEAKKQTSLEAEVARRLDTTNGQLRILRARLGVGVQVLGEAFLPMLREMVGFLNNNSQALGNVIAGVVGFVEVLRTSVDYIRGFGLGVGAVFAGIGSAIGQLSVQFESFVASLANSTLGDFLSFDANKNFRAIGDVLSGNIRSTFKVDGASIGQAFREGFDPVAVKAADVLVSATDRAGNTFANFGDTAARAAGQLVVFGEAADAKVAAALAAEIAAEDLGETLETAGDSAEKAGDKVRTVQDVLAELQDALADAEAQGRTWGDSFDVASAQSAALSSAVNELVTDFDLDPASEQVQKLLELFTKLQDQLADPLRGAKTWAERLGKELSLGLKTPFEVIGLLSPRAEELREELQRLHAEGRYGSEAWTVAAGKLEVLEGVLGTAETAADKTAAAIAKALSAGSSSGDYGSYAENHDPLARPVPRPAVSAVGDLEGFKARNRERVQGRIEDNRVLEQQLELLGEFGPTLADQGAAEQAHIARVKARVQAQLEDNEALKQQLELLGEYGPSLSDASAAEQARLSALEKRIDALRRFSTAFAGVGQGGSDDYGSYAEGDAPKGYVERQLSATNAARDFIETQRLLGRVSDEEATASLKGLEAQLLTLSTGLYAGSPLAQDLASALEGVRGEIKGLEPETKDAKEALKSFEDVLGDLVSRTDAPGLKSVHAELKELAKQSGVAVDPLDKLEDEIDDLEKGGSRSKAEIEALRRALQALRAEAERTQSLERFNSTLEGITDTVSTVGSGLKSLFDTDFSSGNSILEGLSSGLSSFLSLIPGVGGALSKMASTVGSVISSILGDLSNGVKQVQKEIEKTAKQFPFLGEALVDGLTVRTKVSRGGLLGFLGFKKTAIDEEASQAGYDVANSFANAYAAAIENGFDGFGLDINKILTAELIKAFVLSPEIQQKILELTQFSQEAMKDGFIDPSERKEIDRRRAELQDLGDGERQRLIDAGYIEDATPKDGSLAKAEEELAEQKEAFRQATTQAERDAIQRDIDRLEDTIKTLQGVEADTSKDKDATLTFDLPPAIQFALATPLLEASNTMLEAARLIYQTFSGAKSPEMPSYTPTYNVSASYDFSALAAEAGRSASVLQASTALPSAPGSSSVSSYQNALETHGNRMAEHSKAMNDHAAAMRALSKEGISVQSQATVNVKSSSMTEVYR